MSAKLSGAQNVLSASESARSYKFWARVQLFWLSASAADFSERTKALDNVLKLWFCPISFHENLSSNIIHQWNTSERFMFWKKCFRFFPLDYFVLFSLNHLFINWFRILVATRNVRAGEVLFQEKPLFLGPAKISTPICLMCLGSNVSRLDLYELLNRPSF